MRLGRMVFFIVILICSLLMLIIAHYTYHGAGKRRGNMILGVSMTEEGFQNKSAKRLIKGYRIISQWWEIVAIISLIPVLLVCKFYISVGLFVFCIWCLLLLGGGQLICNSFHRELYYLKQKNEWFYGEKLHLSMAGIEIGRMGTKRPLSDLCFIPVFLAGFIPLFYSESRAYLQKSTSHIMVIIFPFIINLIILGFFYHFSRIERRGQREDIKIQTAYVRMERCYWAYGWLMTAVCNTIASLLLQWNLINEPKLWTVDIWIYCLIQSISAGIILYTYYQIRTKREEIIHMDLQPKMVDDDEYWTQGYYNNPYDSRILVNDRIGIGNCINRGKPAGRRINFMGSAITIIGILWILILFFRIDFTPFGIFIQEDKMSIRASMYHLDIPISEIKTVKIKENWKDISYNRESGIETEKYLLGDFQIEGLGLCRIYLYKEEEDTLYIETEDKKIFFNTQEKEEIKNIYEELKDRGVNVSKTFFYLKDVCFI